MSLRRPNTKYLISYRAVRESGRDDMSRTFPGSPDFDVALRQASSPEADAAVGPYFRNTVVRPAQRELIGILFCIILLKFKMAITAAERRLDEGDMLSKPTQILTEVTVTDPVNGETVYPVYADVAPSGEGAVRLNLTDSAQINADATGICDECSLSVLAGECVSGDCEHYDMEATTANMEIATAAIFGDPHMVGLLGQKIDWVGEDGGWYCLISDGEDFQLNVRVTAPMPEEFPDRQLVSGVSLLLRNGHSLVVGVKNPYAAKTDGCISESNSPCLADGGLRVLVDNKEAPDLQIPGENIVLAEGVHVSATNLPAECRPFGGDRIWAAQFEKMTSIRRSLGEESITLDEWVLKPDTLAAPTWCAKYLEDGVAYLLGTQSNHATLRIETPTFDLRLNIGINHQELVTAEDGSTTVPELEFWQTDIELERHHFPDNVGGMLGDTSRFVFDCTGNPIRQGLEALHGPVESYRVADALGVDFEQLHHK